MKVLWVVACLLLVSCVSGPTADAPKVAGDKVGPAARAAAATGSVVGGVALLIDTEGDPPHKPSE